MQCFNDDDRCALEVVTYGNKWMKINYIRIWGQRHSGSKGYRLVEVTERL